MNRRRFFTNAASGLVGASSSYSQTSSAMGPIEVLNGVSGGRVKEAVFFPFDHRSVPFSHGLRLLLMAGKKPGKSNPIVLRRGKPGEPDDASVRFYGTVIPIGNELHMWYLARGELDEGGQLRVCYATSTDGFHWLKPKLGLVEYNGSKANNIVNIRGGRAEIVAIPMIYDPEDPDARRRYKIAFECGAYNNHVAVAFSPDGFNWTESPKNPVAGALEQTGLIRFQGCYYLNGQGGWHYGPDRKIVTHASYDFELWTQASSLSFRRGSVPPEKMATEWNSSEEAHLGAGLWDRGNVILGVYDMWHGEKSSDRKLVEMDLGLLVSHDALHYYEPIPNFRLVPAYEELFEPPGGAQLSKQYVPPLRSPAVSHGQGMCNLGDQTLLWYEIWGVGDIRVATWARDRLGCFRAFRDDLLTGLPAASRGAHHCITCPVQVRGADARVYANVEGLSEHSELIVELLDQQFRPLSGYSGNSVTPLRESGLRQPIRWKGQDSVGRIDGPFRIRATFGGLRPEDPQLYSLYVA